VERVPDIVRLVDAGRIAQALDRLAHNGWAARGSHDDYPTPVERGQMLEEARAAVARAR
jgi:hypothetical protein